jgi:hypothetical protein
MTRRTRPIGLLGAAVALSLAAGACSPAAKPKTAAPLPPFRYTPAVKSLEYFPLDDGASWTHAITRPGLGRPEEVLGVTRVVAVKDGVASITSPGGSFTYLIADDGILRERRTYVIKEPIVVGTRWEMGGPDELGTIEKVDATITTRAGSFTDCVVVREVAPGQDVETTYCPRVGPALIVARGTVGDAPEPLVLTRGELVAFSTGGAAPVAGESETTLEKIESK